jgi:hypothetical protein
MTPSAARTCSTCWLWIPSRTPGHDPARRALLRFLDPSLGTRCPLPPRRARRVHMPVTSPPILASPSLKGWPLSISFSRLNRVRFRYGSHRAPCRASGRGYPHSLPARLHVSQAFHMVNPFSSQEKPGLAWRTRVSRASGAFPCRFLSFHGPESDRSEASGVACRSTRHEPAWDVGNGMQGRMRQRAIRILRGKDADRSTVSAMQGNTSSAPPDARSLKPSTHAATCRITAHPRRKGRAGAGGGSHAPVRGQGWR